MQPQIFSTPCSGHRRAAFGFTLIEMMIVVAVVAILAAIALPSYQESVRKSRRGQAKADLVELAQRVERFHTINNTYVGFSLTGTENQSPREGTARYNVVLAGQTGSAFVLTATPTGAQAVDRCGTLSLNAAGAKSATGGSVADCF